jgi:hypothetical protein
MLSMTTFNIGCTGRDPDTLIIRLPDGQFEDS